LQTLFTDFDCRNDQNLKISRSSPPDSPAAGEGR